MQTITPSHLTEQEIETIVQALAAAEERFFELYRSTGSDEACDEAIKAERLLRRFAWMLSVINREALAKAGR